jgi:putative redox protein
MIKLRLERKKGDYGLEARDERGHILTTDTSVENGGSDYGYRPMQLLLAGLGSCSAIDMISILKKQKQQIDTFNIDIEGERQKDVIPSLWQSIHVTFYITGEVQKEKAEKAATLSMEKYCSVAETLRKGGTTITWNTIVNENI